MSTYQTLAEKIGQKATQQVANGRYATVDDAITEIAQATRNEVLRRQVLRPSHPLTEKLDTALTVASDLLYRPGSDAHRYARAALI